MRSTIVKFAATSFTLAVGLAATLPASAAVEEGWEGRKLQTELRGEFEVPGPGDPNGRGEFTAITTRNDRGEGQLCYTLSASKIMRAEAAHIHNGMAGEVGPVVVTLMAPTELGVSECIMAVKNNQDPDGTKLSKSDLRGIRSNPTFFYVNVHNSEYPDGAIRGQMR